MWIKLAFMCKTPWKFPVCEVRISPNFSRVLWSCSRLPLSPPAGQPVLQESWRDEFPPLPAGAKRGMDVLSLHQRNAPALLAGKEERQGFDSFLGEDSFRFSSSLAFKMPWPLEQPQVLQVALTQAARYLRAHGEEPLHRVPLVVVPQRLGGLGQPRHWEQLPPTAAAAAALFCCRFCRGAAGAYIISSNEVPGVLLWLAHSASLELYSMCWATPGNRGFVLTC